MQIEIRPGGEGDLAAIAQIQSASLQAASWDVRGYLQYDLTVALREGCVVGFSVARRVAEGESELLNLAVDPAFRRCGVGRRLANELTFGHPGTIWLEVRESNEGACKFYKSVGFRAVGLRPSYYSDSGEGAIVMNVHS